MSFEFGRKGPEGINGEGATGYDELRTVPYRGESDDTSAELATEAKDTEALLNRINADDQEDGIEANGKEASESDAPKLDAETEALLKEAEELRKSLDEKLQALRAAGIDPDNLE